MTAVFMTGASGFLGSHVMAELRRPAARCVRCPAAGERYRHCHVGRKPVRGDLADAASLAAAMAGCEAVFHIAADTSMWRGNAQAQTADQRARHRTAAAGGAAGARLGHRPHLVGRRRSRTSSRACSTRACRSAAASWINYERTKHLGEQAVRASGCRGSSSTHRTSSVRVTGTTGRA